MAMLSSKPVKGVFVLVTVTALLAAVAVRLARNPKFFDIELNENGVVGFSIGKDQIIPWSAVTAIRVGWTGFERLQIAWNRWVFLDYSQDGRCGSARIWPHLYGFNAEQLVSMISAAYQCACGSPAPTSPK